MQPIRASAAPLPELKFAGPDIDEATIAAVAEVIRSGQITSGPWVREFESRLSQFCGGRPVRALTSATAAVEVALQLAGIGPGDEVITSAQSFFTVLNMIVKVGARPIFVDCHLMTRNIDLQQVEAAITPATRAIIPTHYPGAMVDMDALRAIAARHRLRVIEDAALVMGSRWRGSNVGASGDLVSFSFHPNKNITSIEGGALVVNDDTEARRVETLRFHGITHLPDRTRDVDFPGGKFNLPDVNARIGCVQLERLPAFLATRRRLVDRYFARLDGRLSDVGCVLPPQPQPRGADADDDEQTWNMFCILLPLPRMKQSRNDFRDALAREGVATGLSYEALNVCTLGRRFGGREGQCPNAERISRETVTLPLHTRMSVADVDRVCDVVTRTLAGAIQ